MTDSQDEVTPTACGNQADKFVQIAIDSHPDVEDGLYALDNQGVVWHLEGSIWIELVSKRHRVTDMPTERPDTNTRPSEASNGSPQAESEKR